MLELTVPAVELWDDAAQMFVSRPERTLHFEHSLAAISKWEMRWEKKFLDFVDKTREEELDYLWCMCLDPGVTPEDLKWLPAQCVTALRDYISAPMSGLKKKASRKTGPKTTPSSEHIYSWMFEMRIPLECENWHLNKLLSVIEVMRKRAEPPKKESERERLMRQAQLNQQRRAKLGTKG